MIILRKAEKEHAKDAQIRLGEDEKKKKDIVEAQSVRKNLGIAVDIGTTTVAMSLYELENGNCLGSFSEKNKQTAYGCDVMMRLMHCQRGLQKKLHVLICEQIQDMAKKMMQKVEMDVPQFRENKIKKMVVVGNATMTHILLDLDISGLAGNPFSPAYRETIVVKGKEIGMEALEKTEVMVLPGVDGHVGADAVAMMGELLLGNQKEKAVLVDFGTNAEIALQSAEERLVCSAPAGPAFEGMEISCGMRGEPGAVASVKIAPLAQNIILDVIQPESAGRESILPLGICGSGLIELIAQLVRNKVIQSDGHLLTKEEALQEGIPRFLCQRISSEGFVFYSEKDQEAKAGSQSYQPKLFLENQEKLDNDDILENASGNRKKQNLVLTQEDVRNFQLAKAAVQTGIQLLLQEKQIHANEVDHYYLAGMFGRNISMVSAVQIGLVPDVGLEKYKAVGNAAGRGAAKALLSSEFQKRVEKMAKRSIHLEMTKQKNFQEIYLQAMSLKKWTI